MGLEFKQKCACVISHGKENEKNEILLFTKKAILSYTCTITNNIDEHKSDNDEISAVGNIKILYQFDENTSTIDIDTAFRISPKYKENTNHYLFMNSNQCFLFDYNSQTVFKVSLKVENDSLKNSWTNYSYFVIDDTS